MVKGRVSVIIAGRSERYFKRTVESVLESATGDVEVIAIVDGDEAKPRVEVDSESVKIIRLPESIGQRAGYNLGVRESSGEYVMKIDAHCLLSKGFDVELKKVIEKHGRKVTVLPEMRRLDAEKWKPKRGGETNFMFPGLDLYCHYWPQYKERDAAKEDFPETMTGQGSCWFCTREWNDHIGLLDEKVGSWGNVGIEISLRTYLCGGSQRVHKKVWQAHYFRKDVVDPETGRKGFPYPLNGRQVHKAHQYTWNNYYFKDDAFENQTLPFKAYIDKFAPVPGWEAYQVDAFKAPRYIVYYTDSKLEGKLAASVRKNLKQRCGPIPIICVSQEPCSFGDKNIVMPNAERSYRNIYEQTIAGLNECPDGSIIYTCEHDVFYHPSHFAFLPPEHGTMYFNTARWYYHVNRDTFVPTRGKRAMSQCVAYKEDLMVHCQERLASIHFEGNDKQEMILKWDDWEKQSKIKCRNFDGQRPNVDILHGDNFTLKGHYKTRYIWGRKTEGEVSNLPGWGRAKHFQSKTGYKKEAE